MRETTVAALVAALAEPLALVHRCGDLTRTVRVTDTHIWPADLVGHLNLIHPERLQVVGSAELAWSAKQSNEKIRYVLSEITAARPPAIIVADGSTVPHVLEELCCRYDIALLTSPRPAAEVIDRFRLKIARMLAERTILHGVLMDVLGVGVLITGEAGTGKSELALELVTRGHGLVADDAVEVARISPYELEGRCPELLQNYLEVRGLGLLDIRTIFGETAVRRKMRLRLITHLKRLSPETTPLPRLQMEEENQEILGVAVPRVTLPVAPGRNMAVLLEAAVRNFVLKLRGIDSTQEFLARHEKLLEQEARRCLTPPTT
ncbi:HPr(Ser) kinase/phosphatase [Hydrogenophilus thermoluteolus]|uniref:HPr(Ser) kinase/phosphatase n=1 Tax=Hydrogenophilus thermoluteolus TaxID=297 RepID=UPI0032DB6601